MSSIKFLNYNSFQKPLGISHSDNEFKWERNTLFADHEIEKFDIIALQEQFTFMNPRPVALLEKAAEKGFYYFHKTKEPDFNTQIFWNDGLLILSKLPIVDADFVMLKPNPSHDKVIEKAVQWVKVELPNGRHLHVFNQHMLATFNDISYDEYMACKMRAIEQLIQIRRFMEEKLEKHFKQGDKAILCGDFNVDALNDEFDAEKVLSHLEMDEDLKNYLKHEKNELHFYKRILEFKNKSFSLTHVFHQQHGYYPVTLGKYEVDEQGNKVPLENIITMEDERMDSSNLDHIFEVHVAEETSKNQNIRIKPQSCQVEEFFVKSPYVTQLSDHYGLSLEIEYS